MEAKNGMNKELLQQRIDEYNKKTEDIVTLVKKTIYKINDDFEKNNDSFSTSRFEYLQCILQELYQHYLRVEAFIDGCKLAASDELLFRFEPLLEEVFPTFSANWYDYVVETYDLKYSNLISSIVHI